MKIFTHLLIFVASGAFFAGLVWLSGSPRVSLVRSPGTTLFVLAWMIAGIIGNLIYNYLAT